ncbi:MAG: dihydrofolate reductase family protein [Rhodoblastus sp.]
MPSVRVACFSVSFDGFSAAFGQSIDNPIGVGGLALFDWMFATRTFQKMHGAGEGETGVDDDFAADGFAGVGAWILGRNMFGPVRGRWPDESWKGWWGEEPPYRTPVFVLTHFPRAPVEMKGGTTFHFVTDGIDAALERARAAAGSKDVRIGGGVATIRQYLRAGLIDRLHLAQTPVLLGEGEPLLAGLDLPALGYRRTGYVPSKTVAHVILERG